MTEYPWYQLFDVHVIQGGYCVIGNRQISYLNVPTLIGTNLREVNCLMHMPLCFLYMTKSSENSKPSAKIAPFIFLNLLLSDVCSDRVPRCLTTEKVLNPVEKT